MIQTAINLGMLFSQNILIEVQRQVYNKMCISFSSEVKRGWFYNRTFLLQYQILAGKETIQQLVYKIFDGPCYALTVMGCIHFEVDKFHELLQFYKILQFF